MIKKDDVIEFFNERAKNWDAEMEKNDVIISEILDNVHVTEGVKVLDVACGTGVLIPYYLERKVASVLGVDISEEMIEIAKGKFKEDSVSFLTADAETDEVGCEYDCIVIYNAFPHFPDPDALLKRLTSLLKEGGYLTVAHGMSREAIDAHHNGPASKVSNGLMSAVDLAAIFSKYLKLEEVLSTGSMYQVVGKKEIKV